MSSRCIADRLPTTLGRGRETSGDARGQHLGVWSTRHVELPKPRAGCLVGVNGQKQCVQCTVLTQGLTHDGDYRPRPLPTRPWERALQCRSWAGSLLLPLTLPLPLLVVPLSLTNK